MKQSTSYCALIAAVAVVIVIAGSAPHLLSDDGNSFLKGFVNHELLSILGVILAITLGSAAQLHLTFNKIEEDYQRLNALSNSRRSVHGSAFWLIGFFIFAILSVLTKPLIAKNAWSQALFNGVGIIILIAYVLILIDLLKTAFSIGPKNG